MSKFLSWTTYLIFGIALFVMSTKALLVFWSIQVTVTIIAVLWKSTARGEKTTHLPFMIEGVLSIIMLPMQMALNPIMYWSYLFSGNDRLAKQCWTFSDEYLLFIWNFLHNRKPAYYR